jgi:hypothetical protein
MKPDSVRTVKPLVIVGHRAFVCLHGYVPRREFR